LISFFIDVTVPDFEAKPFDAILEEIAQRESPAQYEHLRSQYDDVVAELDEINNKVLAHTDTKMDNLNRGYILDLEGLKKANPAVDLSLYLVESGISQEEWMPFVQTYLEVVQKETGRNYTPNELVDLTNRVRRVATITAVKELGGLYSREMTPQTTQRADQLKHFLEAA